MRLELDIEKIAKYAKSRFKENISFQEYLKEQDTAKIDKIVHKLNKEITPQIECVECGNCCHNVRPIATEEELSKFVEPENIQAYKYLKGFTCKFLDGKKCSQYLNRYEECKEFPYLDIDGFLSRTVGTFQSYELCPIVFNVIEQLKQELGWKVG